MSKRFWIHLPDGRWSLWDDEFFQGVALLVQGQKLWLGKVVLDGRLVEFNAPTVEEAKFKVELML